MKSSSILLLLLAAIAFNACKPDDPDPPVCPDVWEYTSGARTTYSFADSKVTLETADSTLPGVSQMLYQDSLRGDFTISLGFQNFDPGDAGDGAFMQLMVANGSTTQPATAKATIGNVSPAGLGLQAGAVIDPTGLNPAGNGGDYAAATEFAGSLTISRTGDQVTATSRVGGVVRTQTATFNTRACAVAVQLGSNYQKVTGATGAVLTTFTLSGGGTEVSADDFGCDSFF